MGGRGSGRRPAWSLDEEMRLVAMVHQGHTYAEISTALGRSTSSVRFHTGYLRQKGVRIPRRRRRGSVDVDALNDYIKRLEATDGADE